jgi:hypothetical protein
MTQAEPGGFALKVVDLASFRDSRQATAPAPESPAWLPMDAHRSLTDRQVDHRRRMLKHLGTGRPNLETSALLSPQLPLFGQIR